MQNILSKCYTGLCIAYLDYCGLFTGNQSNGVNPSKDAEEICKKLCPNGVLILTFTASRLPGGNGEIRSSKVMDNIPYMSLIWAFSYINKSKIKMHVQIFVKAGPEIAWKLRKHFNEVYPKILNKEKEK
jgi:hypothetical protein